MASYQRIAIRGVADPRRACRYGATDDAGIDPPEHLGHRPPRPLDRSERTRHEGAEDGERDAGASHDARGDQVAAPPAHHAEEEEYPADREPELPQRARGGVPHQKIV